MLTLIKKTKYTSINQAIPIKKMMMMAVAAVAVVAVMIMDIIGIRNRRKQKQSRETKTLVSKENLQNHENHLQEGKLQIHIKKQDQLSIRQISSNGNNNNSSSSNGNNNNSNDNNNSRNSLLVKYTDVQMHHIKVHVFVLNINVGQINAQIRYIEINHIVATIVVL